MLINQINRQRIRTIRDNTKPMKLRMKAYVDLLEDHYTSENRGYEYGECVYLCKNGTFNRCIMGIVMTKKELYTALVTFDDSCANMGGTIDEIIQADSNQKISFIHEFDKDFLMNIQAIHDNNKNWDEEGLTEEGRDKIDIIRRAYKLI